MTWCYPINALPFTLKRQRQKEKMYQPILITIKSDKDRSPYKGEAMNILINGCKDVNELI